MARLEELLPNAAIRDVLPDAVVTVVSVQWFGSDALELFYETEALSHNALVQNWPELVRLAGEHQRVGAGDGQTSLFMEPAV